MLKIVEGNLLTGPYPIFCHQVNCKGVMGSGIAKQIKELFSWAYLDYKELCDYCDKPLLGKIQLCHEPGVNGRICVNMFAQDGYGRDKRYTNYDAFQSCLDALVNVSYDYSLEHWPVIGFPYGIGCGLGGGDWNKIYEMIFDFSGKVMQDVCIVKLHD